MPQPATGPADAVQVAADLKGATVADDLGRVVAAVNAYVRGLPVAELGDDVETWPANVVHGANMLAARLYRRRNTPSGVETFGDLGAVYVRRNDPDVAMLLQLGDHGKPAVG